MKTYRAKYGPFNERPYFSDSEIETTCLDELRAVGLYPDSPTPIRIDRFIEKRFKVVPTYEDLGDGILGLTKFGRNGVQEVVVSKSLEADNSVAAERCIRTTLAHEGGHGIFHTHLFTLSAAKKPLFGDFSDPDAPKVLCRDEGDASSNERGYKGQWWEFQANKAIGGLLMPKPLVEMVLEEFLVPSGLLGLQTFNHSRREIAVQLLADTFDVNAAVARIRIAQVYPLTEGKQMTL